MRQTQISMTSRIFHDQHVRKKESKYVTAFKVNISIFVHISSVTGLFKVYTESRSYRNNTNFCTDNFIIIFDLVTFKNNLFCFRFLFFMSLHIKINNFLLLVFSSKSISPLFSLVDILLRNRTQPTSLFFKYVCQPHPPLKGKISINGHRGT